MNEIANHHHAARAWDALLASIENEITRRRAHPARTLVLLPYAQLMAQARSAWADRATRSATRSATQGATPAQFGDASRAEPTAPGALRTASACGPSRTSSFFMPRFETSMNWANALGPQAFGADDLRMDAAIDLLTAQTLLARAGLAAQQAALAPRLVEAAMGIARVAAAQHPAARADWGARLAGEIAVGMDAPVLALELALGQLAVAWVAHSGHATDSLWQAEPDLLVVVDGFLAEPLPAALREQFQRRLGDRVVHLPLALSMPMAPGHGQLCLQRATDGEDEARRAAATVLARLNAGTPVVALIAQDRLLTRRIHALLADQGVRVHDETGWKLSTTRAAASVVSCLDACAYNASADAVLAWVKSVAALDASAVDAIESLLRRQGQREWPPSGWVSASTLAFAEGAALEARQPALQAQLIHAVTQIDGWRKSMRANRSIAHWLAALQRTLAQTQQWAALQADVAGLAVCEALHMAPPADHVIGVDVENAGDVANSANRANSSIGVGGTVNAPIDATSASLASASHDVFLADAADPAEPDEPAEPTDTTDEFSGFGARISLSAFTAWVRLVLEEKSVSPGNADSPQVVILPLAQLLGRPLQAVVLAGCDERRLPASSEPAGLWTAAQRVALGLPSRDALSLATRQAWDYALQSPQIDVLWRCSEDGEPLMPCTFVQEVLLRLQTQAKAKATVPVPVPVPVPARVPMDLVADTWRAVAPPVGVSQGLFVADFSATRELVRTPTPRPKPSAAQLPVLRLSASAYDDLRTCPYRFFALRQLRLQEAGELDTELQKRDFGNWLHGVLLRFHQEEKEAVEHIESARLAMINRAADAQTRFMNLSAAEFLPWQATWPRLRDGYLQWLRAHDATGARFERGEVALEQPMGRVVLHGKIDRIDRGPAQDSSAGGVDACALLIDYKTGASGGIKERIELGSEDTQLAFYAALVPDGTVRAAYVHVGDKEGSKTYEQTNIVALRDGLVGAVRHDVARIAAGAALPALGEGIACDYCAARGLCRKDFWAGI